MKLTYITLFLLLAVRVVFSQQAAKWHFYYTYDASGNRILRDPHWTVRLSGSTIDSTIENSQSINNLKISIMPNPTKGILNIKIEDLKTDQTAKIYIQDIKGLLINKNENADEYSQYDISDKPNGIYFLVVYIGKEKREWKIIKTD